MKVKFLKGTFYRDHARIPGDIMENIPNSTAIRWQKNGIAEIIEEIQDLEPVEQEADEVEAAEVADEVVDYSTMKAKELYELCLSRGIEVETKKNANYYISKLEGKPVVEEVEE